MIKKALYAGSFDPLTNGHLDIIRRAAKLFDSLTVGVVVNPGKSCLFSLDERIEAVRRITGDIPNVEVSGFDGLLADYVKDNGFTAVVRGLRDEGDLSNEMRMAQINATLYNGEADTVFLVTDPGCSFISSSMVKEVASLGGSVHSLVPEYTEQLLINKLRRNE